VSRATTNAKAKKAIPATAMISDLISVFMVSTQLQLQRKSVADCTGQCTAGSIGLLTTAIPVMPIFMGNSYDLGFRRSHKHYIELHCTPMHRAWIQSG
jgi:hypothetical protein